MRGHVAGRSNGRRARRPHQGRRLPHHGAGPRVRGLPLRRAHADAARHRAVRGAGRRAAAGARRATDDDVAGSQPGRRRRRRTAEPARPRAGGARRARARRRGPAGRLRAARRAAARLARKERAALRRDDRRRARRRRRPEARRPPGRAAAVRRALAAGRPAAAPATVRPRRRHGRVARAGRAAPGGARHAARTARRPDAARADGPLRGPPRRVHALDDAGHAHRGLRPHRAVRRHRRRVLRVARARAARGRRRPSAAAVRRGDGGGTGADHRRAPRSGARAALRAARAAHAADPRRVRFPDRPDGAHMDAPVPLILVALLAAAALVAPTVRSRAAAMLGALAIAPVILVFHISDSDQFHSLTDRPSLAAAAGAVAVVLVLALAVAIHRWPSLLPVLAVAAVPFRVPIALGGTTANLLVPLYGVVAAGVLAYAVPRLAADEPEAGRRGAGAPGGALAAFVALYAIQASYSIDFDRALENIVFFYVPFALLFVLVSRIAWTPRLTAACLGVLVTLALVFAGIGFVEYATRHLFLNPKVIASNQFEAYFRVNSLFFDPNIYGRFLAIVIIGLAAALIWSTRPRDIWGITAILAVLMAGLVLTLSQSSFAALLLGLLVLAGARWSPRWAVGVGAAALVVGALFVLVAPSSVRLDLNSSKGADPATSGRYDLVKGGLNLFADKPLAGYGSGAFSRAYRRAERGSQ